VISQCGGEGRRHPRIGVVLAILCWGAEIGVSFFDRWHGRYAATFLPPLMASWILTAVQLSGSLASRGVVHLSLARFAAPIRLLLSLLSAFVLVTIADYPLPTVPLSVFASVLWEAVGHFGGPSPLLPEAVIVNVVLATVHWPDGSIEIILASPASYGIAIMSIAFIVAMLRWNRLGKDKLLVLGLTPLTHSDMAVLASGRLTLWIAQLSIGPGHFRLTPAVAEHLQDYLSVIGALATGWGLIYLGRRLRALGSCER